MPHCEGAESGWNGVLGRHDFRVLGSLRGYQGTMDNGGGIEDGEFNSERAKPEPEP